MKNLRSKYICLTIVLLMVTLKTLYAQIPNFSKVPLLYDGDSINITYLISNGVQITAGKAICWFPKDSLSEQKMNVITSMINAGIKGAEKLINVPLPWQLHAPTEPYTLYFRFDRFVSHAYQAGFVSIPFRRIKEGKSPWLHEIMHEMLGANTGSWFSKTVTDKELMENMPHWLFEGLPDYVSQKVSLSENLPLIDVFSNSRQTNIDGLFMKDISSDKSSYILSFIGTKGVIPELSSENRFLYAPAFYHGSASFTRYLADNYGIKMLLTAISSFKTEMGTIESLTGKTLEVMKKEWLDKLIGANERE